MLLSDHDDSTARASRPATFILVFDEAWELAERLSRVMERTTGNTNNGDILAWLVDPREGLC